MGFGRTPGEALFPAGRFEQRPDIFESDMQGKRSRETRATPCPASYVAADPQSWWRFTLLDPGVFISIMHYGSMVISIPRRSRDKPNFASRDRQQCVYVWYEKSRHPRAGRILYDMAGFVDLLCLPAGQNSNPSSSSQKSEVINPGYDS